MSTKEQRVSGVRRLRFLAVGVVFMLIATFVAGIVFGFRAAAHFDDVRKSWEEYTEGAEAKGFYLSQIRGAIGYGGFIHHFQDYVVGQDPELLSEVQRDLADLSWLILQYNVLGTSDEEQVAIRQLQETIKHYGIKLEIARDSVAKGRDPGQADILAKIDDFPALEALSFLEEIWRKSRDEATATLNQSVLSGRDTIKSGIIFLPVLLVTVIVLLGFLRRLLREIADRTRSETKVAERTAELAVINQDLEAEIAERVETEQALRSSEASLSEAQRIAQLGNWRWDFTTDDLWWSDEVYRIYGIARGPAVDKPLLPIFVGCLDPSNGKKVVDTLRSAFSDTQPVSIDHRIVTGDGLKRTVQEQAEVYFDDAGLPVGLRGTVQDITDRSLAEQELRKLTQVVEQSPASVIISDTKGAIEYVNAKFVDVTGYASDEILGKDLLDLQSGLTAEAAYDDMWDTVLAGNEWRGELHSRKKNGNSYWEYASVAPIKSPSGVITNFIHSKEDITLRKEYEERLLRQANFDDLTGLPNRVLALDRLSQAIAGAHHGNHSVVIMHIDVDNFRNVNDLLGRATGDRLLKEAAERLNRCLHKGDTVARLGSDEFLAVLPGVNAAVHAEVVAQDILDAVGRPFVMGGQEVFLTASMGLTVYPSDGYDPQVLMRDAEAAMYRAKERGRNAYRFFTPEMNAQAVQRVEIENNLRDANQRNELFLHYQPIVKPATGDVVGAEALLRWQNPDLGMVWPDQMIPIAEETGLIVSIGAWVLDTACADAKSWHDQGAPGLRVTVNLSPQQFSSGDLATVVSDALERSGLAPEFLELEIKESLIMADDPATVATLLEIREMGVRLSIDDFGTGYSAINYLKRFPFDVLKIDRSFVRGLGDDPQNQTVATAIIAMAHSLDIEVVGEGVETAEELKFLLGESCDQVQGFYFSEPLPQEDFADLLKEGGESGRIVFL
jgi:diguanylate cyclase (GGDEF)-like protein/PAS domain S-box-containing protein